MIRMDTGKKLMLMLLSLFLLLFFERCEQIDGISLDVGNSALGVNSLDTFSVQASTFLLDPLPTGNQGVLLTGSLEDEYIGRAKISSFFRLEMPDISREFSNDVQFDSLTLRLFYNGYSYGDTTQIMHLSVHRLTEALDPRELSIALEDDEYPVFVSSENLYADQSFAYDTTPLGKIQFIPKPKSVQDTVLIRLDQTLGNELFQMVLKKDSKLVSEDEFLEYLKGLAIIPSEDAHAIIGFKDSIAFNLHYSYERQSDGRRIRDSLTIGKGDNTYQYNHVETDRSAGLLKALSHDKQEITAAASEGRTFIQGTTGLVTRLRFPYLRETLGTSATAINQAQLIVETDQSETGYIPPLDSLIILKANKYGTPTALLQNAAGSSIMAVYETGSSSGGVGRGRYVFDVTNYIHELVNTKTYNGDESLLLSLPTSDLLKKMDLLYIATDANKPAITLNILYIKTQ
ncbi:DUF4270 family protein [Sphingobacterium suaedae]|uniref:DUF4270 family protein n=2 Tax=Sphingobacterium suaedae TaxID=1686402 RepID=A0ABW5KHT7_9SPHI